MSPCPLASGAPVYGDYIVADISNIQNKIPTYEETENLNQSVIVEPQCNQNQNKIQPLVQKDLNSRNVAKKHMINFNKTEKQSVNQHQENQTILKPKLKKIKPLKLKKTVSQTIENTTQTYDLGLIDDRNPSKALLSAYQSSLKQEQVIIPTQENKFILILHRFAQIALIDTVRLVIGQCDVFAFGK